MKRKKRIKAAVTASDVVSKVVMTAALVVLILLCISQIIPLIWMILTSFKDNIDYSLNNFGFPEVWHPENYTNIFKMLRVEIFDPKQGFIRYGLGAMFINSLLISALTPIMGILSSAVTAYVLCKYKFKGNRFLQNLNIFVMIVPIVGALPASLSLSMAIGRYDNLPMMILLGASPFGFNLLFYYNAFKAISWSYSESAFMDGAGHFTVFFKIMLPMMTPILAVMYVLAFMGSWNDYMTPLIWLPSTPNLALGMYLYQYDTLKYPTTIPEILAGFVIVSLPSVAIFIACQGLISKNLAFGGLKG